VGLYVTTAKDYREMRLRAGEQTLKDASLQKEESDRMLAEAESAKKEAQEQQSRANTYTQAARKQITAESELISSAERDTNLAEGDLKKSNAELFKSSYLPEYVYSQQAQIAALATDAGRPMTDYEWLSGSSLKRLSLILVDDGDTLGSIPDSVRELAVTTQRSRLDLRLLRNPKGLTRLLIKNFRFNGPFELLGLSSVLNLKELSIDSYATQLKGLDNLARLPNLTRLSLTATSLDSLSPAILNRLTTLRLWYDRNVRPLGDTDYQLIGASRTLRELIISSQLDSAQLRTILHAPSLESLFVRGSIPAMTDRSDVFPGITTIQTNIKSTSQLIPISVAFPNVKDLSFFLEGSWSTPDIASLIAQIHNRYSHLQSLSIHSKVHLGPSTMIEVPPFADLTRLRLSFPLAGLAGQESTIKFGLKELVKMHRLTTLIVDGPIVRPEELPNFDALNTLILNNVDDSGLIRKVGTLSNISTFGIDVSQLAIYRTEDIDSSLQRAVSSLSIKTLILGFGAETQLKQLPPSVNELYLGGRGQLSDRPFEGDFVEYH
jgi:hypothetical protein